MLRCRCCHRDACRCILSSCSQPVDVLISCVVYCHLFASHMQGKGQDKGRGGTCAKNINNLNCPPTTQHSLPHTKTKTSFVFLPRCRFSGQHALVGSTQQQKTVKHSTVCSSCVLLLSRLTTMFARFVLSRRDSFQWFAKDTFYLSTLGYQLLGGNGTAFIQLEPGRFLSDSTFHLLRILQDCGLSFFPP